MSKVLEVPRVRAGGNRTDQIGRLDNEGTRDLVFNLVVEQGPITASRIGKLLHLTPAAVRRHLGILQQHGVIEVHESFVPHQAERGRPARRFVATESGRAVSGTTYASIAAQALSFLRDKAGDAVLGEFVDAQVAALEKRYAPVLEAAGNSPLAKVEALSKALTSDGYASSVRGVTPGAPLLQLCQGNCPIEDVAREFPEMCDLETRAFSRLLGVHVQRLATLAGGEHVCTTVVPLALARMRAAQQEEQETKDSKNIGVSKGTAERSALHRVPATPGAAAGSNSGQIAAGSSSTSAAAKAASGQARSPFAANPADPTGLGRPRAVPLHAPAPRRPHSPAEGPAL